MIIKKMARLLTLSLLVLTVLKVNAIEVKNLYSVLIAVEEQSYETRKLAYQSALETIFVRVSGKLDINQIPAIRSAIKSPVPYVNQYQYKTQREQLYLSVSFNETAVNKLLKDNQQTIWGKRRPLTLWWIVVEDDNKRTIISDSNTAITHYFNQISSDRGIPIIFPLMDLDDQINIDIIDLWGRFHQPVIQASEKYQADLIASTRLYQQKNDMAAVMSTDWIAEISIIYDGEIVDIELTSPNKKALWPMMMNAVADHLSLKYSIKASSLSTDVLYITIENIHHVTDAIEVQRFLSSMTSVNATSIDSLSADGVTFKLKLLGEAIDVFDAISLDRKLTPVIPVFGESPKNVDNLYRWNG